MVKKILPVLVLGVLLTGLLAPGLVSAQLKAPQDCCKIGHKFTVEITVGGVLKKFPFEPGDVVTAPLEQNPVCDIYTGFVPLRTKDWGIVCMLNTFYTATNWFFYILIILSTILIIWGAFGILFAAGDPEKMKKGRTTVIYALSGIAIALFAKVIPAIVKFMMGV